MTLREYFIEYNTDKVEFYFTDNFHIFIQNYQNDDLCIELCDNNGNSKNILCDITLNTDTLDLSEILINSILDTYLYKN